MLDIHTATDVNAATQDFPDGMSGEEDFPSVGELLTSSEFFPPTASVNSVAELFFRASNLDAIAVVGEDQLPIGVVTRQKFLFTVFRRFGWEIYGKKPIREITDEKALVVVESERLDEVLELALHRSPLDVYDDVIVVGDDRTFRGLLSVKQLVVQQSHSLANILVQKDLISVQKDLANTRAQELERIGELKSQFLANVTHELRSPVNAIIELTELIRTSADRGYIDQLHDRLALLMSSASNLRSVITNMLDLSKLEAGKMQVIDEVFDLAPLLHELAETTRVLLGRKQVEVQLNTDSRTLILDTDPVKVRQILLNLLSNATKFTDAGVIRITAREGITELTVEVADTGLGIRKDDLDRLFVAFNQLEDARAKRHGGTGLGLSISRELAALLGGSVSVVSDFGKGSAFSLHLPLPQKRNTENDGHA